MRRYEAEAGNLAVEASREALDDSGVSADRITHIVTVTCSGFFAPGLDVALIKRLGLRPGVERTQVGFMGCHGAINGMRVARAIVGADRSACVLLCCAELCSLHHQYDLDPSTIIANALFADGAAAHVGVAGDSRPDAPYRVVATGSTLIDDSEDVMSWRIGDHGFAMTLSAKVPKLIVRHLRPWLDGWLASHGLRVETVPAWAVHPGGPRILTAFSEATGIGRGRDRGFLSRARGVWEYVVADGPVRDRRIAEGRVAPTVRGIGVRAGAGGRGGSAGLEPFSFAVGPLRRVRCADHPRSRPSTKMVRIADPTRNGMAERKRIERAWRSTWAGRPAVTPGDKPSDVKDPCLIAAPRGPWPRVAM